jgi:hypothetical protein
LDFYDAVWRTFPGSKSANALYQNRGNNNNWLAVKLQGKKSNSSGIGARVRIVTGQITQIRDVTCELGSGLQTSLPVEFGLGEHEIVDSLIVRWPGGTMDILTNIPINQIITIEEGYGDISVPTTPELSQNYPNPFNQTTSIRFSVSGNSHNPQKPRQVRLKIFNILGHEVSILVDEFKPAGKYTVKWHGTNRQGESVSSGVYLCQLQIGEIFIVNKMLLLR